MNSEPREVTPLRFDDRGKRQRDFRANIERIENDPKAEGSAAAPVNLMREENKDLDTLPPAQTQAMSRKDGSPPPSSPPIPTSSTPATEATPILANPWDMQTSAQQSKESEPESPDESASKDALEDDSNETPEK